MGINLTGLWKNKDYDEWVSIVHNGKMLFAFGFGMDKDGKVFQNMGIAEIDEETLTEAKKETKNNEEVDKIVEATTSPVNNGSTKNDDEKSNPPSNGVSKFSIVWTDLPTSTGSERKVPHRTEVEVENKNSIKKINVDKDPVEKKPTEQKHIKSYGDWIRQKP